MSARAIALLRGINVGGTRKVPMEELRAVAKKIGLSDIATYIQSGNLLFTCKSIDEVGSRLEKAIEKHFGFAVPIIVRTAAQWAHYASGSPFADAQEERPNLLHIALASVAPSPAALELLTSRAAPEERVAVDRDALWIDYSSGVARSKLTPALLDRAVGATVTARNWKTVLKLQEMLSS
jgi:uncharacterized protein (DUF1697 family)